jgi:hypothetical protein
LTKESQLQVTPGKERERRGNELRKSLVWIFLLTQRLVFFILEVPGYDLYYSLTHSSSESFLGLKLAHTHITPCLIFIK